MAVLQTGQSFASGDQVTATKLQDIANLATFRTGANQTADGSTIEVDGTGGYLKVPSNGIGTNQLSSDASNDANRAVDTNHIKDGAVTAAKLDSAAVSVLMPTGSILPYAGSSAPTGYAVCGGQEVFRTGTYANLFSVIGTTYGAGDGINTFALPDLRGRVIAGKDNMGGNTASRLTNQSGGLEGDNLGATGGSETHTLSVLEIPAHTHTYNDNGNSAEQASGGSGAITGNQTVQTGSTGGGNAHNNVQPTIILNYIIKT